MSHEIKIHDAQTAILRELLFQPRANFALLQKRASMSSDHFNFHIHKLVELGLVEKLSRGSYALTPKGKEHANKLDTDNNTIERQPKIAVILNIERTVGGRVEHIFQERLKHPYYGFWGLPTGKVRWGETIVQTAERELMEETGLTANCRIAGMYHELVYQEETGGLLEDKVFFVIHCTDPEGDLKLQFEGGRNEWMTREKARSQQKIFSNAEIEINMVNSDEKFIEQCVEYSKDNF